MRNLLLGFAMAIALALAFGGVALYFGQETSDAHAKYLRDTYRIAADYIDAMDVLETAPPEVGLAFALSAERVLSGPQDVQWLIACGDYRAVRARIASMRRDLEEIQAYRASR